MIDVPLIETRNLKKFFSTPKGLLHAVDDISLSIGTGKTLGVVGESGCGKSTLGRVMIRLLPATSGEVLYKGENILSYNSVRMKEMRKNVQIIFQDPYASLNPRMTVSEIIAEPLKVCKICPDKESLHKKISELMDTVGLASRFANTYPHELDGGRRQRIGIARALAVSPEFIVCDEPVSALDVSIQAQIINLLEQIQAEMGISYIFIAHDLAVVKHISDRILVMYLGRVMEIAPCEELYEHSLHPYTQALLSAIPVADPEIEENREVTTVQGEVPSILKRPSGCPFHNRCPQCTERCKQETPQLHEAFPGHFVACHLYGQE